MKPCLPSETGSFSGLVRRDGQKAAAQTNRLDAPRTHLPARLMGFVSLAKPEVLLLVLITTAAGSLMASESVDAWILFRATVGTGPVAAVEG